MPRTKYFDIDSPILSKVKTPLDNFNLYILPVGLIIILVLFIYIFYIGMQKKKQDEI